MFSSVANDESFFYIGICVDVGCSLSWIEMVLPGDGL